MIRPFSASYECGRRLVAVGIPLDYLEILPRKVDALRSHLYIGQLGGDCRSRVLDLKEGEIRYLLALRLSTNLSRGIVISNWSITTPWDHYINWDYDPADIVPASDHPTYGRLLSSPLSDVLDNKRHLSRGRPVDGLLSGCAFFQSIPRSIRNGATVHASLSLTDDTGRTVTQDIEMIVDRRAAGRFAYAKRKGRLFEKRDLAARTNISSENAAGTPCPATAGIVN
jgi:hypothetical protein